MQPSEKITPRCIAGTMAEQCYRSYRPMREKLIARIHTVARRRPATAAIAAAATAAARILKGSREVIAE